MTTCPYCAEDIEGSEVFCPWCGSDLRVPVGEAPPAEGSGQSGDDQHRPDVDEPAVAAGGPPPRRGHRRLLIGGSALVVLLLAGGGFFAFHVLGSSSSKGSLRVVLTELPSGRRGSVAVRGPTGYRTPL